MPKIEHIRRQVEQMAWPDWIPGADSDSLGEENARLRVINARLAADKARMRTDYRRLFAFCVLLIFIIAAITWLAVWRAIQ